MQKLRKCFLTGGKMSNQISAIMYHFVRDLPHTRYPALKGLSVSQFKKQLDYLTKYYQFVTIDDCLGCIYSERNLPRNSAILTFDDAYIDHYTTVFPILEEREIQGVFFPPAKAILNNTVLDVNKIHFLLATLKIKVLLNEVFCHIDKYRTQFNLFSNEYYFNKLACKSRYDTKEVIFVKRLLQKELDEEVRGLILNDLFTRFISSDEAAFSRELYMTVDQLRCMARNGMYIGSHGYNHYWLDTLPSQEQEKEIDQSLKFLKKTGSDLNKWVMCYPYSGYNDLLIKILKKKGCAMAFTTNVGIATLNKTNAFTIERFDTNDFPKRSDEKPTVWTQKVLQK